MKDKIILEEIAKNSDITEIRESNNLIILEQEYKKIGNQFYKASYKIQLPKISVDNTISTQTSQTSQSTEIPQRKRIYREIAMEESDPIDIDEITMSDTEFMEIIAGRAWNKKTIYKRKSYASCMRKFLESFYVSDDRKYNKKT